MRFNDENIELFRSYIASELNEDRRIAFEERLSNDSDFKLEFDAFLEFEKSIEEVEVLEIYDTVGGLEKEAANNSSRKKGNWKWLALIGSTAAAIVILISVFRSGDDAVDLVSDYFEPYDNVVTVRGKKEVLDKGLEYYDRGEYTKSIKQFEQYPSDTLGIFYTAESLMMLEKYSQASEKYDVVITQESIFKDVALFHKAIALVGKEENEKAKVVLRSISSSSSYYDKARNLLDRL